MNTQQKKVLLELKVEVLSLEQEYRDNEDRILQCENTIKQLKKRQAELGDGFSYGAIARAKSKLEKTQAQR